MGRMGGREMQMAPRPPGAAGSAMGMGAGAMGNAMGMGMGMGSSTNNMGSILDSALKTGGQLVSAGEEFEFEFMMAGIKPQYADMAAGFQSYLTTCPSFKNNLCHEDLGGSERLRSPCPVYLQCYYCLRINPLYCLSGEGKA